MQREEVIIIALKKELRHLSEMEDDLQDEKDALLDDMDEPEDREMGMFYLIDEVESEEYSIYEIIDRDNDDVLDRTIKDIIGRI